MGSTPFQIHGFALLPLHAITVVPGNPRQTFHKDDLAELAASIQEYGVLEPILVSPLADNQYRLIAGERRWRASHLAKKDTIPALIGTGDEATLSTLQLGENLWRVPLTPIEEALAFEMFRAEMAMPVSAIAKRVKRSPAYVRARLQLLKLSEPVRAFVAAGTLSLGAALVLTRVEAGDQQERLAREVVQGQLSIEQTSTLVNQQLSLARQQRRRDQLRDKRDAWVEHLRTQVPVVLTRETFDPNRHRRSPWLFFPECAPCLKKGIYVSDLCVGEDCCVDPTCYAVLVERAQALWNEEEQECRRKRAQAFARASQRFPLTPTHWRYLLWTLLRGLLSSTNDWRANVGLSAWHGGTSGAHEWEVLADWPVEQVISGVVELTFNYIASHPNSLLPDGLKASLRAAFDLPLDVLGLPHGAPATNERKVET